MSRYAHLLSRPFALLSGQLLTFFCVSLYVKLVEMLDTSEYGTGWTGSGRLFTIGLHCFRFCGQELCLFAALLVALAVWQRCVPRPGRLSVCAAWLLGLVIFPILSVIEVLGLAHFAFFLTPLGPEEVRQIAWARRVVSASNVLSAPEVTVGLLLVVTSYYLAPCAVWCARIGDLARSKTSTLALVLLTGVLAASAPKPLVPDAMLAPHPLLWLLLGSRAQPEWADANGAANVRDGRPGRVRFTVAQRPTNVLIFVLESTRADSVAMYNAGASAGRELLRFRDEMVVFDHVYAPVPTSAHAIFSILYGFYPYLGPFWLSTDKSVVADSLGEYFAGAGYATQMYVTGDLNYDNIRSFAAPGFERVLDPNDWPGQEQFAWLPWGRDDRLLTDEIKRFIASRPKRPFFLFAMTSNPHHPYAIEQLPGQVALDDARAAYERLVDYDFHLLAELYDWMKQRGVAQKTLLLVLGDHGEAFGEHPGNYGHAAFIYEENVHIPCFILHPGRLGLPRRIAQLGSEVDLRATILDILGRRDSDAGDGMSLLREDPERMIANFTENGVTRFGVRDTRFTYIYTPHAEAEQVFDRRRDPNETRDIAEREPSVTARYRKLLRRWETQHQLSLAKILR